MGKSMAILNKKLEDYDTEVVNKAQGKHTKKTQDMLKTATSSLRQCKQNTWKSFITAANNQLRSVCNSKCQTQRNHFNKLCDLASLIWGTDDLKKYLETKKKEDDIINKDKDYFEENVFPVYKELCEFGNNAQNRDAIIEQIVWYLNSALHLESKMKLKIAMLSNPTPVAKRKLILSIIELHEHLDELIEELPKRAVSSETEETKENKKKKTPPKRKSKNLNIVLNVILKCKIPENKKIWKDGPTLEWHKYKNDKNERNAKVLAELDSQANKLAHGSISKARPMVISIHKCNTKKNQQDLLGKGKLHTITDPKQLINIIDESKFTHTIGIKIHEIQSKDFDTVELAIQENNKELKPLKLEYSPKHKTFTGPDVKKLKKKFKEHKIESNDHKWQYFLQFIDPSLKEDIKIDMRGNFNQLLDKVQLGLTKPGAPGRLAQNPQDPGSPFKTYKALLRIENNSRQHGQAETTDEIPNADEQKKPTVDTTAPAEGVLAVQVYIEGTARSLVKSQTLQLEYNKTTEKFTEASLEIINQILKYINDTDLNGDRIEVEVNGQEIILNDGWIGRAIQGLTPNSSESAEVIRKLSINYMHKVNVTIVNPELKSQTIKLLFKTDRTPAVDPAEYNGLEEIEKCQKEYGDSRNFKCKCRIDNHTAKEIDLTENISVEDILKEYFAPPKDQAPQKPTNMTLVISPKWFNVTYNITGSASGQVLNKTIVTKYSCYDADSGSPQEFDEESKHTLLEFFNEIKKINEDHPVILWSDSKSIEIMKNPTELIKDISPSITTTNKPVEMKLTLDYRSVVIVTIFSPTMEMKTFRVESNTFGTFSYGSLGYEELTDEIQKLKETYPPEAGYAGNKEKDKEIQNIPWTKESNATETRDAILSVVPADKRHTPSKLTVRIVADSKESDTDNWIQVRLKISGTASSLLGKELAMKFHETKRMTDDDGQKNLIQFYNKICDSDNRTPLELKIDDEIINPRKQSIFEITEKLAPTGPANNPIEHSLEINYKPVVKITIFEPMGTQTSIDLVYDVNRNLNTNDYEVKEELARIESYTKKYGDQTKYKWSIQNESNTSLQDIDPTKSGEEIISSFFHPNANLQPHVPTACTVIIEQLWVQVTYNIEGEATAIAGIDKIVAHYTSKDPAGFDESSGKVLNQLFDHLRSVNNDTPIEVKLDSGTISLSERNEDIIAMVAPESTQDSAAIEMSLSIDYNWKVYVTIKKDKEMTEVALVYIPSDKQFCSNNAYSDLKETLENAKKEYRTSPNNKWFIVKGAMDMKQIDLNKPVDDIIKENFSPDSKETETIYRQLIDNKSVSINSITITLLLGVVPRIWNNVLINETHKISDIIKMAKANPNWGVGDLDLECGVYNDKEGSTAIIANKYDLACEHINREGYEKNYFVIRPSYGVSDDHLVWASEAVLNATVAAQTTKPAVTSEPPIDDSGETTGTGDQNANVKTYHFFMAAKNLDQKWAFPPGAKVKEAREKVASEFNRPSKEIFLHFLGKELRDEFVLDRLRLGTAKINIYLRDNDEVVLLTAPHGK
ncbi:MAG: hypothetical protein NkDv07_0987 [Candidatus Improbicoccus devescovinae]|nr:MAG: hypothetical protein NkDv07_0987 [Candidatus Improbicoccus devescovinae]